MKKLVQSFRLNKKTHAMIAVAVFAVVGATAYFYSHGVFAYSQLRTVNQDGGYDNRTYDNIPVRNLPKESQPATTNPGGTVDITVQSIAANGSSAAGYKQKSWQITQTFSYAWNRGLGSLFPSSDSEVSGYVSALSNPNITIGYDFGIYDANNPSQLIPEGSTVAGGKQVILKFKPYVPDNIFWFGTGYSMDSPYGEWRANAAPPARTSDGHVTCMEKDLTAKYDYSYDNSAYGAMTFDVYIPFVVNPPSRSLSNTSGLSCGALTQNSDGSASATCTVTGDGPITPSFNYSDTYGRFYYRYYDYRDMNSIGWGGPGCYGNNIPLSTTAGGPAYSFSIPAQTFAYPLVATPASNKPATPTLTCPSAQVGQDVTVTMSATDPDGDQVKYGVDWIDDGTQEVNSGWTALVPSGTSQTLTKTGGYATAGTYTIYGWAQDSHGVMSNPASCTLSVANGPQPDLTAGPTNAVSGTAGTSVTLQSNIANVGPAPTGARFTDTFFIDSDTDTTNGFIASPTFTSGIPNGFPANYSEPNAQVSYTFPSSGTYHYRACADNNSSYVGVITESNENNNCSNWSTITIGSPQLSCTVSSTSVQPNQSVTYTSSGGGALQNFNWTPSDGVGSYGNSSTASRTFTSAGSYGMTVSRPGYGDGICPAVGVLNCSNPSATITATPTRVVPGGNVILSYSATGVDTGCTISGPGLSQPVSPNACVVAAATLQATNITTQSVFKISCDNGESVAQAIVNVVPKFQDF